MTSKRAIGKVRTRGLGEALILGSPHPWTTGNAVSSVVGIPGNTVATKAGSMSGLTEAGGHGKATKREPINAGRTSTPEPMINREDVTAFANARSFREHTAPVIAPFCEGSGPPWKATHGYMIRCAPITHCYH